MKEMNSIFEQYDCLDNSVLCGDFNHCPTVNGEDHVDKSISIDSFKVQNQYI